MHRKLKIAISITTLVCTLLSGCNKPVPTQISSGEATLTSVGQTAMAILTQQTAPGVITPVSTIPRLTVPPTITLPPRTPIPPQTEEPSPTALADQAEFVSETIPDGTSFPPGTAFTKTWRLRNLGSATWTTAYALVFVSGDKMSGPDSVPLSGNVPPGAEIDLSVNLKAPTTKGTVRGNWKLRNSNNMIFGLGGNASAPFWVEINVLDNSTQTLTTTSTLTATITSTTVPIAVSNAVVTVDPSTVTVACPYTTSFTFTGYITINGPGSVSYRWERSDGTSGSTQTINFTGSGTQTVNDNWTISSTTGFTGWEKLHILSPNDLSSNQGVFVITCSP